MKRLAPDAATRDIVRAIEELARDFDQYKAAPIQIRGDLDMQNYRIVRLGRPQEAADAQTKDSGGESFAPISSAYVTIGTDATLDAERALTAGAGITISDGGANGLVTISTEISAAPDDASYVVLGTDSVLSAERVLTAGSGISITDGGAGSTVTIAATPGSGGVGTVTSVAVTGQDGIGVTGSPITSSGTIDLTLGNITPLTVNATKAGMEFALPTDYVAMFTNNTGSSGAAHVGINAGSNGYGSLNFFGNGTSGPALEGRASDKQVVIYSDYLGTGGVSLGLYNTTNQVLFTNAAADPTLGIDASAGIIECYYDLLSASVTPYASLGNSGRGWTALWLQDNAGNHVKLYVSGAANGETYKLPDVGGTLARLEDTLAAFAPTTSAELAGVLTDETGFSSGAKSVFSINPTITECLIAGPGGNASWTIGEYSDDDYLGIYPDGVAGGGDYVLLASPSGVDPSVYVNARTGGTVTLSENDSVLLAGFSAAYASITADAATVDATGGALLLRSTGNATLQSTAGEATVTGTGYTRIVGTTAAQMTADGFASYLDVQPGAAIFTNQDVTLSLGDLTLTNGDASFYGKLNETDSVTSVGSSFLNRSGFYGEYTATDATSMTTSGATMFYVSSVYGAGGVAAKGTLNSEFRSTIIEGCGDGDSEVGTSRIHQEANIGTGYTQSAGPVPRMWLGDWTQHGPIAVQPTQLNGLTLFQNNYYNGSPSDNPSVALALVTGRGSGSGDATHAAASTYPLDVGLAIVGKSNNGSNGIGFTTGLQIGGYASGWMESGSSIIGTPLKILDFRTQGILIDAPETAGAPALKLKNTTAASTPASGYDSVWFDTTDQRLHDKNAAGTVGTTVVADTGASNQFLTAISAAGVVSKAAITDADVPNTLTLTKAANLTTNGFVKTSGGDGTLSVDSTSSLSGSNTGDVTLAGTPDYITISGQVITRAKLDPADDLNTFASSVLAGLLTDETGTDKVVFNTSPTLVTPILGTPTSGTLTNCTGLPVAGITASTSTALGVGSLEIGHATDTTLARSGSGDLTIEGNAIYRAGGTDVPVADGGTGRSTGTTAYALVATGTTATGAQQTLASGATTEILVGGGASALPVWTTATGSGAPVRATSPTLTTPALGTPSSGTLTSCTGLPLTGLVNDTTTAVGVGSIELGHASDTTIARAATGAVTVEGRSVPLIIACSGTASATTNANTETNLKTVTIPAGLVGVNGMLMVDALWKFTGTNNTKIISIRHNTTSAATSGGTQIRAITATSAQLSNRDLVPLYNANSASAQVATGAGATNPGPSGVTTTAGTIDTGSTSYLNFNASTTNSGDTAQLLAYCVTWYPGT